MAQVSFPFEIVVIADAQMLEERARLLGLPLEVETFQGDTKPVPHQSGKLKVLNISCANTPRCSHLDSRNATYVLDTLHMAVRGCLETKFAALVTGPVHKGNINDAGIEFTGHTELLAELSGSSNVIMMLVTAGLRVALVTTHIPLCRVCDLITSDLVENTLKITRQELQQCFAIAQPNIIVCGLNPHAGEGGYLGHEETQIIIPVLEALRSQGFIIEGPLPADTAFIPKYMNKADVFIAMYHDQGLPVLKHMGFGNAVNISLGMPFIRTSVDHGTALELAGKGNADATSLISAINTAHEMIINKQAYLRNHMAAQRA